MNDTAIMQFIYTCYSIGAQSIRVCTFVVAVNWFARHKRLNSLPLALCLIYGVVPLVLRVQSIVEFKGRVVDKSDLKLNLILNCISYGCLLLITLVGIITEKCS